MPTVKLLRTGSEDQPTVEVSIMPIGTVFQYPSSANHFTYMVVSQDTDKKNDRTLVWRWRAAGVASKGDSLIQTSVQSDTRGTVLGTAHKIAYD